MGRGHRAHDDRRLDAEAVGLRGRAEARRCWPGYQALGTGKAGIFSSGYLPGRHQYLNAQAGKVEILSVSYGPVPGGLMVPAYVPASTIADLQKPEMQKLFGGKIVGIDAGSGVMAQAKKVVDQYGLNFELVPSSDAAMAASFKAAYEKKEPIIITIVLPTLFVRPL